MNLPRFCGALGLSILLLAGPLTDRAGADAIPSDFDDDGDVDLADFAEFQPCALGPAIPQTDPACTDARLDTDQDVDLDDFEVFQGCFSGPDNPADPNCACAPWQTFCDPGCVDLMTDPFNCGACYHQCAQSDVCAGGTCQGQCSGCEGGPGADPIPSDFDDDGDVDLADFAEFQSCVLGSTVPQTDPACTDARLDADQDVDLDDFGVFQGCLSGPDNPADPNCACPSGFTNCNGTCTFTGSDSANCGTCGNACAAGLVCQNSSCQPCPAGLTACSGVCAYLVEDPENCGSCGNVCPLGTSCLGGACQPNDAGCSGYCAGLCSGECVNLCSDAGNCGSCGHQCQSDELCTFGVCTGSCSGCEGGPGADPIPSDFDDDGDVDLADFAEFQPCFLGSAIPQTDAACAGAHLDADEDVDLDDFAVFQGCLSGPDNPADPNCACLSGETNCAGTCVNTTSDHANCGACGNVCPADSVCVNGSCVTSCNFPFIPCDVVCVDPTSDHNNCGGCGVQCADDEACIGGSCVSG